MEKMATAILFEISVNETVTFEYIVTFNFPSEERSTCSMDNITSNYLDNAKVYETTETEYLAQERINAGSSGAQTFRVYSRNIFSLVSVRGGVAINSCPFTKNAILYRNFQFFTNIITSVHHFLMLQIFPL